MKEDVIMLHFKFGLPKYECESHYFYKHIFENYFEDSWIDNDDVAKSMVANIDNSIWLGGGLLRNKDTGKRYNFTGLCAGTQSLLVATHFSQYWWCSHHMGVNMYDYVSKIANKRKLNFMGFVNSLWFAEHSGFDHPPMIMEDFDNKIIDTWEDFELLLAKWIKTDTAKKYGNLPKRYLRYEH